MFNALSFIVHALLDIYNTKRLGKSEELANQGKINVQRMTSTSQDMRWSGKPLNVHTVQTFNPCTSRLGVCQCQVVQTPMDDMLKDNRSKHINDPHSLQIETIFSYELIHSHMPINRVAIGRAVMYYDWAAHAFSFQELDVGTA